MVVLLAAGGTKSPGESHRLLLRLHGVTAKGDLVVEACGLPVVLELGSVALLDAEMAGVVLGGACVVAALGSAGALVLVVLVVLVEMSGLLISSSVLASGDSWRNTLTVTLEASVGLVCWPETVGAAVVALAATGAGASVATASGAAVELGAGVVELGPAEAAPEAAAAALVAAAVVAATSGSADLLTWSLSLAAVAIGSTMAACWWWWLSPALGSGWNSLTILLSRPLGSMILARLINCSWARVALLAIACSAAHPAGAPLLSSAAAAASAAKQTTATATPNCLFTAILVLYWSL